MLPLVGLAQGAAPRSHSCSSRCDPALKVSGTGHLQGMKPHFPPLSCGSAGRTGRSWECCECRWREGGKALEFPLKGNQSYSRCGRKREGLLFSPQGYPHPDELMCVLVWKLPPRLCKEPSPELSSAPAAAQSILPSQVNAAQLRENPVGMGISVGLDGVSSRSL